jgi:Domain of unknown function (DUF222)
MFEDFTDAALIDAIGEASRDESAAIARRFAAIGQLDALRAQELAERNWWRTVPYEEVTAEISAAQNISWGRASTQVHYARVLRDRLPEVANVFATGAIDEQVVATIIARTENVDDEVIERLDAALARQCVKWMRLSGPKLRDRIDLWVAKLDPAGVRIPPKAKDNRYWTSGRRARGWPGFGRVCTPPMPHRWTSGSMRWRPRCVRTIGAPLSSVAPMPPGRWRAVRRCWRASAAQTIARRRLSGTLRPTR